MDRDPGSYAKFFKNELKLLTRDVVERDPSRYPNGAMRRDTIRRQLGFASLRVGFRSIVVDDETELCAFSLSRQEQAMPWSDVVKYLGKVQFVVL